MAVNDSIIWIYIARRDKAGVKLLTQLRGKKILASHLESVDDLRLPLDYKDFIKKSILWKTVKILQTCLKNTFIK